MRELNTTKKKRWVSLYVEKTGLVCWHVFRE